MYEGRFKEEKIMQLSVDLYMISFIMLTAVQLLLFRFQCFRAVDWITHVVLVATSMLFFIIAIDALTSI